MKKSLHALVLLCGLLMARTVCAQDIKVLVNHLGYEQEAPKRAVILGHAGDNATDGMSDDWTDQAEQRVWFLSQILGG